MEKKKAKGMFFVIAGVVMWVGIILLVNFLCGLLPPAITSEINMRGIVFFSMLSLHFIFFFPATDRSRLVVFPTMIILKGVQLLGWKKKETADDGDEKQNSFFKHPLVFGIISISAGIGGWILYYFVTYYVATRLFGSGVIGGHLSGIFLIVGLHVIAILSLAIDLGDNLAAGAAKLAILQFFIWPTTLIFLLGVGSVCDWFYINKK